MDTIDQYGDPVTIDDLKPCPFCGSPAEIERIDNIGLRRWEVRCTECPCKLHPANSPKAAAIFWNKRSEK